MKILKTFFVIFILVILSGCIQTTSLLGPGITVATSGNVLQAGLQYGANTALKNETGKDVLERGFKLKKVDIDNSFPKYIIDNKEKLKKWII